MKKLKQGYGFTSSAAAVFLLIILLFAPHARADDSPNQETMDPAGLAAVLRGGLFTRFFDSASVSSWKNLITTLEERGQALHAKRVAWISLFHPLAAGRSVGAMAIINMTDLSDPKGVWSLLAMDNDCLRNMFVELAEGGYFQKYAVAPQLARLLEDERYLRRNRQGRLVRVLRALYHYTDTSVAGQVARYLDDPSQKVRENSARTLGRITGHTFSKTGDMDLTPKTYYVTKAKVWWSMNKNRPEYNPGEKHPEQLHRGPEPEKQPGEDDAHMQVSRLQSREFLVWAGAFKGLFEFGLENEAALINTLQESEPVSRADAVYRDTLIRLVQFYGGKRKTESEYRYKKRYDVMEFCY